MLPPEGFLVLMFLFKPLPLRPSSYEWHAYAWAFRPQPEPTLHQPILDQS